LRRIELYARGTLTAAEFVDRHRHPRLQGLKALGRETLTLSLMHVHQCVARIGFVQHLDPSLRRLRSR
jgi:hypothetical protein